MDCLIVDECLRMCLGTIGIFLFMIIDKKVMMILSILLCRFVYVEQLLKAVATPQYNKIKSEEDLID